MNDKTNKTNTKRLTHKASERIGPALLPETNNATELYQRVDAVFDDWRTWAKEAAYSKLLTPLQFLAVVVWVLEARKGDELSEDEKRLSVAHWGLAIDRGMEQKILVPLHGVSLLPVPEAHQSKWVLSIGQLTDLMERLPWAFDLKWALGEFGSAIGREAEDIATWQEAAALHKKERGETPKGGKKPKWTHAKLKPISNAIASGVNITVIATAAGISRQSLDGVLKAYEADPNKYGKPDHSQIQVSTSKDKSFSLGDWPPRKSA